MTGLSFSQSSSFHKVLDSSDATTGGGTASAIAGAMAGALVSMVAKLSIGKKTAESEAFYTKIATEADQLSKALLKGAQEDSEAYGMVRNAFRLPKKSSEEIGERKKRIAEAMLHCTLVPLENAEKCRKVNSLAVELKERCNVNALSDVECGEFLAIAGLSGCLANVAINLPGLKDHPEVDRIKTRADELNAQIGGKK